MSALLNSSPRALYTHAEPPSSPIQVYLIIMVSTSINPSKRSPFIFIVESAGHKCRVPIHIFPGTDVRNLNMERPATLVAIGKSDRLGLHLDS
jgi:hypothetical protein